MNVANSPMPIGASGTVTAAAGTSAVSAGPGLGELFSLQMGQALQGMLTSEEQQSIPEGLSEEDQKQLDELMALIQQLLAGGQQVTPELVHHLEEKTEAIAQLALKNQGNFPQLSEEWKQLLTKLTQGEPATDEMNKLAALLDALNNQKGVQEAKRSQQGIRSEIAPSAGHVQQHAMKPIQTLRLNQGLSAYKSEAGIQSLTWRQGMQTASAVNPENEQVDGIPLTGGQVTTAATNLSQAAPTFSQTGTQHHVQANQLPQQVAQIFVKQMKLTQVNGVHEAKLILHPQSLGQVDVTITSHNGVITAHFSAETQAGKDLLDNQLPQLRAALTQQGLQVDRLEVNQQQTSAFDFQQQREQARQQQENGGRKKQNQDDQAEFTLDALVDGAESTSSLWNRLRESTQGIDDIV